MNFDDTPQEAAFRAEARAWIEANAPKDLEAELSQPTVGRIRLKDEDILEESKKWQKKKAEAGWACLHWPKEYGGGGASPIERVIWQQEEGIYGKLEGVFLIGQGMCGPTVMAYGSQADKAKYLPKIASGEHIWCQLFSEPLGGLRRRGPAHPRGKERRRMDRQRPESLDHRRAFFRLRHRHHPYRSSAAQAQGPDHVLARHEVAGRHGEADQAGQWANRNSTRCISPT